MSIFKNDNSINKSKEEDTSNKQDIEYFKKRCEILENGLFKLQTQNKKLEDGMKKLQEMNAVYAKNMNNTSITFYLPSEFKSNWENLLKDKLIDGFESLYDNFFWLSHIVQDTMKCVYEESNNVIRNKIKEMLNLFNIKDENIEKYLDQFRNFFQEHFFSIFIFTDDFLIKIKESLLTITKEYKDFPLINELESDLQSKSFKIMIQTSFKLTMYMLLHDPLLTLKIEPYQTREIKYLFYEKGEYINIDGFEKSKTPCVVILSAPLLRNNYPYQGIKPAVLIIPNPTDTIKQECSKNSSTTPKKAKTSLSAKINFTVEKEPLEVVSKTDKNLSLDSPKKIKNNDITMNSNHKTIDCIVHTEALSYYTCPNEMMLMKKESIFKEKDSVSIEEENDKILINESKYLLIQDLDLNNEFCTKIKNTEERAYQRCLDKPLSMDKKLISEYSSILLQNLKNNLQSLRETSTKSNRCYDSNLSKSKEHKNLDNLTSTNLSSNNNPTETMPGSRTKNFPCSVLRLCEANKINYPLKISTVNSTSNNNNNIFTMKEYKNNVNFFNKIQDKKEDNEIDSQKYNSDNTNTVCYYKPKQINPPEVLKSNLKKNVKDAYDYVTNTNHINPLKFDFNSSGKKNLLNDMKYNAPKKDNFMKSEKHEKTESNFKIKVERIYSNMTPENSSKISVHDSHNFSSKKELNFIDKKNAFMKSMPNNSINNQIYFKK